MDDICQVDIGAQLLCLYLKTGIEVIAEVERKGNSYRLYSPIAFELVPTPQGMALSTVYLLNFADQDSIDIECSDVLYGYFPNAVLKKKYEDIVLQIKAQKSGIVLSKNMPSS